MNKFITLAVVLFAVVASTCANPPGYGQNISPEVSIAHQPLVQQVAVPLNDQHLQQLVGASNTRIASSSAISEVPALVPNPWGANHWAGANLPSVGVGYSGVPQGIVGVSQGVQLAGAGAYGAAPHRGARPLVQNAVVAQLNPGQNNYRTYVSPPQWRSVALPIQQGSPAARLWVPQAPRGKIAHGQLVDSLVNPSIHAGQVQQISAGY